MSKLRFIFIISLLSICYSLHAKVFVQKNGKWIPIPMSAIGYANEASALGYKEGTYFVVQNWGETLDSNGKITAVAFKLFTTEVIFVETEDFVKNINDSEVDEIIDMVNTKLEDNNCTYLFDDLLNGIAKKTITLSYISKCLNIPYNANNSNGILTTSSRYNNMKLFFKNGFLSNFTSKEGYSVDAMRKTPEVIDDYVSYFKEQHPSMSQKDIVAAINMQTKYSNKIAMKLLRDEELKNKFRLNNRAINYCLFALYGGKVTCTLSEFMKMTYNMEEERGNITISGVCYRIYTCMDCYFFFKPNGQLYKVE